MSARRCDTCGYATDEHEAPGEHGGYDCLRAADAEVARLKRRIAKLRRALKNECSFRGHGCHADDDGECWAGDALAADTRAARKAGR